MKINKRFFTLLGIGFVALGLMLSFLGFALSGFSTRAYNQEETHWYYTFHLSDHSSSKTNSFFDSIGLFFD